MSGPYGAWAASLVVGWSGGLLSDLFGAGGGIILLPLLRLTLGLQQHQAQGITLAAMVLPSGLPAMAQYRKRGLRLPWPLLGVISLGFFPAVWGGAHCACLLPEVPLRWFFVGLLLLLAAWTLGQTAAAPSTPETVGAPLWKGGLVGLLGGFCSGLFGIGGGIVMIPLLALWLGLTQHQAQLISLAVMVPPIRLPGVLVYARGCGDLPWSLLGGVACGFALGAYLGACLATCLPASRLRGAFVGLILLAAGVMIWKG